MVESAYDCCTWVSASGPVVVVGGRGCTFLVDGSCSWVGVVGPGVGVVGPLGVGVVEPFAFLDGSCPDQSQPRRGGSIR